MLRSIDGNLRSEILQIILQQVLASDFVVAGKLRDDDGRQKADDDHEDDELHQGERVKRKRLMRMRMPSFRAGIN